MKRFYLAGTEEWPVPRTVRGASCAGSWLPWTAQAESR